MSADNWTRCPNCNFPDTFREDYEIFGAEDGVVMVTYEGHSQRCGSHLDFRHEVPVPPKAGVEKWSEYDHAYRQAMKAVRS